MVTAEAPKGAETDKRPTWQGDPNGVPITPSGNYVRGDQESQRRGPQDGVSRPTKNQRLRGF